MGFSSYRSTSKSWVIFGIFVWIFFVYCVWWMWCWLCVVFLFCRCRWCVCVFCFNFVLFSTSRARRRLFYIKFIAFISRLGFLICYCCYGCFWGSIVFEFWGFVSMIWLLVFLWWCCVCWMFFCFRFRYRARRVREVFSCWDVCFCVCWVNIWWIYLLMLLFCLLFFCFWLILVWSVWVWSFRWFRIIRSWVFYIWRVSDRFRCVLLYNLNLLFLYSSLSWMLICCIVLVCWFCLICLCVVFLNVISIGALRVTRWRTSSGRNIGVNYLNVLCIVDNFIYLLFDVVYYGKICVCWIILIVLGNWRWSSACFEAALTRFVISRRFFLNILCSKLLFCLVWVWVFFVFYWWIWGFWVILWFCMVLCCLLDLSWWLLCVVYEVCKSVLCWCSMLFFLCLVGWWWVDWILCCIFDVFEWLRDGMRVGGCDEVVNMMMVSEEGLVLL